MYHDTALAKLEKSLQASNACLKNSAFLIDRVSTLLSRTQAATVVSAPETDDQSIHARLTSASQVQKSLDAVHSLAVFSDPVLLEGFVKRPTPEIRLGAARFVWQEL